MFLLPLTVPDYILTCAISEKPTPRYKTANGQHHFSNISSRIPVMFPSDLWSFAESHGETLWVVESTSECYDYKLQLMKFSNMCKISTTVCRNSPAVSRAMVNRENASDKRKKDGRHKPGKSKKASSQSSGRGGWWSKDDSKPKAATQDPDGPPAPKRRRLNQDARLILESQQ